MYKPSAATTYTLRLASQIEGAVGDKNTKYTKREIEKKREKISHMFSFAETRPF